MGVASVCHYLGHHPPKGECPVLEDWSEILFTCAAHQHSWRSSSCAAAVEFAAAFSHNKSRTTVRSSALKILVCGGYRFTTNFDEPTDVSVVNLKV